MRELGLTNCTTGLQTEGSPPLRTTLMPVGCVDGSHTTKRAFDAVPDVIATPKELLRDMMELLSDPHLKSLILIRSPTDLMVRLRTLEAESVQQTVHQSKQAAITARQGVSDHVEGLGRLGNLIGST